MELKKEFSPVKLVKMLKMHRNQRKMGVLSKKVPFYDIKKADHF